MDINERLQQEKSGSPIKINPDEQRRYLGTFRERVVAAVKKSQITNSKIQSLFENTLKTYKDGKVVIDQRTAGELLSFYVALASKTGHSFTIISDQTIINKQDDPIVVLLQTNYAVNIDNIYFN
ncbi:DUF1694 domain-containing protein [Leuconostoc palmae]|uniref:DUF1694 domain-containing protein n=1 Tax=Leuconostoc palmae TaxID=501487 RepID=UPI001C7E0DCC|nr:DUF1694 domain-containing protein [Leuconostoc palmae]